MRVCKLNGCIKPESEFYQRKSSRNGKLYYSTYCKQCEREKSKNVKRNKYHDSKSQVHVRALSDARTKNPEYREKLNSKLRQKYANNESYRLSILNKMQEKRADPEQNHVIRQRAADYYQNNKLEIRKRHEERVANNPWLQLRGYMRGRISEVLKAHGKSKGGVASLHYLSYSWSEFYSHIESKFEDWMTWANYGEYSSAHRTWQIDHIIPQKYFPYESMDSFNFRACWNLQNIRPLCSKQNLEDGDREGLLGDFKNIQELLLYIVSAYGKSEIKEPPRDIFERSNKVLALNNTCPMPMVGLSYLDSVFTQRFSSNTAGFQSFKESLSDDLTLIRVITHLIEKGDRITPAVVFSNLRYVVRTPGHFFPMSALSIINAYADGKHIFDPFLGWGGRCLGSLCSKALSYTGCDLQPEVVEGCRRVAQDFATLSEVQTEFHHSDCLSFLRSTQDKYDLIFTSPPYMDTENYGIESDAMRQNWLDDFVFPFADECTRHLAPGGHIALHLKDLKGAPTFTAYHAAMKAVGFKQIARHRYGRTWTQAVYVYGR